MKVLVTGATGFVGACLTQQLVREGYDVHTFVREQSNLWRLQEVLSSISRHTVDLTDFSAVTKAIRDIRPNFVCHLATYGGFSFQRDQTAIFMANFMGTVNLVQACEQVGFDYFINTGSSSEYGVKRSPMSEADVLVPVGDYSVSKAATTLYCQSEAIQKALPIITARLFSPYGPWDDPQRFVPYCMKTYMRGETVKVATPDAVRDYVFIEDVIDFYLHVLRKQPAQSAHIFNVGSGQQVAVGEVAGIIGELMDAPQTAYFGHATKRSTESPVWRAEVEQAREIGWRPKTSLQEGLKKTVSWMREHQYLYP